jgi:hypothetical protein
MQCEKHHQLAVTPAEHNAAAQELDLGALAA